MNNILIFELESFGGFLNMSFDNLLFNNFEKIFDKNTIVIRFFTFVNHTITLGYSQKRIDEEILKNTQKWFKVRRITGGKAVFHYPKKDLVISIITLTESIQKLINKHSNLINETHEFVNQKIWKAIEKTINSNNSNKEYTKNQELNQELNYAEKLKEFNCFLNPQKFETIHQGKKIVGTAIKISQNKIIIQANVKIQLLIPSVNKDIHKKLQTQFISLISNNPQNIITYKLSKFITQKLLNKYYSLAI